MVPVPPSRPRSSTGELLIQLQHASFDGVDYVSWTARIEHLAGAPLAILKDGDEAPCVALTGIARTAQTGVLEPIPIALVAVFSNDTEVAASEYPVDAGTVAFGQTDQVVGFEGRFRFQGEWQRRGLRTKGPWAF